MRPATMTISGTHIRTAVVVRRLTNRLRLPGRDDTLAAATSGRSATSTMDHLHMAGQTIGGRRHRQRGLPCSPAGGVTPRAGSPRGREFDPKRITPANALRVRLPPM